MVWLPLLSISVSSQYAPAPPRVPGNSPGRPNNGNFNEGLTFNQKALIHAVVEELTNETLTVTEQLLPTFIERAAEFIRNQTPTTPRIPTGLIQIQPPHKFPNRYNPAGPFPERPQDSQAQEWRPGMNPRPNKYIQHNPAGQSGQLQNQYGSGHKHGNQYGSAQHQNQYGLGQHPQAGQYNYRPQNSAQAQQAGSGAQYSVQHRYNGGGQQNSRPTGQGHPPHKPTPYRLARSNRRWKYKHYDYNDEDRIDGW
ncbi:unnamed protein product [Allacma fusca]|uniref:Uncharacterized protein n=1 Tax=Allacma fusca TaxID=39272 RepID=A0A8J2Q134_9HEXA|nr:unnamed protein product [Allacma fusca]